MTAQQPGARPAPGAPAPAAGWYPDPGGYPMQRWWGGSAWGEQTRPYPQPPAPAAQPRVPVRWAWTVASLGAAGGIVTVAAAALTSWSAGACAVAGFFAADFAAVAFAEADSRALKAAGERNVTSWLAILFSPLVYLAVRAGHLRVKRGAWGIFAAGLAVWAVAFGVAGPAAGAIRDAAAAYPSCMTGACIAREIESSLTGGTVKDGSVMTSLHCDPSTVKHNDDGSWTESCAAAYSDGSSAAGSGTLLPAQGRVTFQPASVSG